MPSLRPAEVRPQPTRTGHDTGSPRTARPDRPRGTGALPKTLAPSYTHPCQTRHLRILQQPKRQASSELWAPLSCILLRAAWQSLAECRPKPTVARPPNSTIPSPTGYSPNTPQQARPSLGPPTIHPILRGYLQGPGPSRPGRNPQRISFSGPGPTLSRCPPQGRHRHDGQRV